MRWCKLVVMVAVALSLAAWGLMGALAEPSATQEAKKESTAPAKWAPAVESKPLSAQVQKGLDFLVKSQLKGGGWGQGEESRQMGQGLALKDTPSVADTCICTLALIRAGSTPKAGPHAAAIRKALDYLCAEIEESDSTSLFITKTRGTRVQGKLGQYVDTFMAAQVLAEVKDAMPDAESRKRLMAALDKVMDKIEKNQKSDGTWASDGWAPTLAQAMGVKALNKAAQAGVKVSEEVRARTEQYAAGQFDRGTGGFKTEGAAGVQLYSGAANLGAMQDSANTNDAKRDELKQRAANAPTEAERKQAKDLLERFDNNERALKEAKSAIVKKLDDDRFIQGFGSNGGEEFLSYMNIGESLVVKGGDEWKKWDEKITANLNRVQNEDGSWSGHHCITGRTFCTAAALLVLTVDRAPVPVAAKIKKQ
ncbi:MAG: terpene cyclase/mutase family protein [Planctomycetes bacterium]|nr:terpene cyclase/mutase family protein [Planctomycetota bacterium]